MMTRKPESEQRAGLALTRSIAEQPPLRAKLKPARRQMKPSTMLKTVSRPRRMTTKMKKKTKEKSLKEARGFGHEGQGGWSV
jgi:hypothetical protein